MRINKFLASAGIASRRAIDQFISEGRILVNKKPIELGYQVQEGDKVTFDGKHVSLKRPGFVYILLNKPKGYVTSASDELGRKTVLDLIDSKERIYPVGRLDKDTTGVLLLTNDGDLAYKLSHPKFEVLKRYTARTSSSVAPKDLQDLSNGIMLDDQQLAPCTIKVLNKESRALSIELHEGKYRQIRRMFEARGYEVLELDRTNYASLTTEGVATGSWRPLTKSEVKTLSEL